MDIFVALKDWYMSDPTGNALAIIGTISIAMTGIPIPKAGTLLKIYKIINFLGGNFGKAKNKDAK